MRAVFFDLDGTLVELPDEFEPLFEAALADLGVSYDPEYYEVYLDAFFEYLDECHDEPYRAAMADLCAEFDFVPDFEESADAYVEREVGATDLAPGARETLETLDGPLGVLTNGAGRVQRRKLEHHDLDARFDAVVVSSEVGAGKPDPEIFAAARDAISADEFVFVADDLTRDVLPAQAAGFTGVYVSGRDDPSTGDDSADAEERADVTVSSLREVPDVLD